MLSDQRSKLNEKVNTGDNKSAQDKHTTPLATTPQQLGGISATLFADGSRIQGGNYYNDDIRGVDARLQPGSSAEDHQQLRQNLHTLNPGGGVSASIVGRDAVVRGVSVSGVSVTGVDLRQLTHEEMLAEKAQSRSQVGQHTGSPIHAPAANTSTESPIGGIVFSTIQTEQGLNYQVKLDDLDVFNDDEFAALQVILSGKRGANSRYKPTREPADEGAAFIESLTFRYEKPARTLLAEICQTLANLRCGVSPGVKK